MEEKELVDNYNEKIDHQDQMIDEVLGLLKQTKNTDKKINSEVNNQKVFLNKMGEQIDVVKINIDKTGNKLDDYNKRSSNTWLVIIILIQIFILFMLVFVL